MTGPDLAAGRAGAGEILAAAPGGLGEIAAHHAAAAEFAHRGEGAAIAAIVPFIGTADIAVQPGGIGAIGHRLVVAIDVAADDIAEQAAHHHTADCGASVAPAGYAAQQTARQGAENRAVDGIAAPAAFFIAALLVIGGRSRRRRRRTVIVAVAAPTAIADAAIAAVAVIIAIVIGIAVITIGVITRRHPARLGRCGSGHQSCGRAGGEQNFLEDHDFL